jgi:hypothetical protein
VVQQTAVAAAPGWKTALEVIVAPTTAFTRLREAPKWFWAFVIAAVLAMAGSLLIAPTIDHYMASGQYAAELARNPAFANLPSSDRDARIQAGIGFGRAISKFNFVIVPIALLLVGLIQSVVMLIAGAATGAKSGTFAKYWAISMNAAVVGGVGALLNAIIVIIRGADSFTSITDFQAAVPGLALLIPASAVKLHAFFSPFTAVGIWSVAILALGMMVTAGVKRVPAIAVAVFLLAIAGLFASFSAN